MGILDTNGREFNVDGALVDAYGSMASNPMTGLGSGRDKSAYLQITKQKRLGISQRIELVKSSRICRRAVFTYPNEAATGWCKFVAGSSGEGDKFDANTLSDFFSDLPGMPLREAFRLASIEARWHGNGYVLLAVEDGGDWADPVNWENVQAFRWAEPLYDFEVTPNFYLNPSHYSVTIGRATPDTEEDSNSAPVFHASIHRDRIIHFKGDELLGMALMNSGGSHQSVLQTMLDSFSRWLQGNMASASMLSDYSVFRYKLKGLGSLIKKGETDGLLARFLQIQMGMSTMKGLMFDADTEDADFVSRSYAGVNDIMESLLEQMVASSDLSREKLLGSQSQSGLGGEGRGIESRVRWASELKVWRFHNWYQPLRHCSKLALLAADGPTAGVLPEGFDVVFPSTLELSELEQADLRDKVSTTQDRDIKAGIISPHEVRMSRYGAAEFTMEVTLDDRETKRSEEKMLNPPNPLVEAKLRLGAAAVEEEPSKKEERPFPEANQDAREFDASEGLTDAEWAQLSVITAADFVRVAREAIGQLDNEGSV